MPRQCRAHAGTRLRLRHGSERPGKCLSQRRDSRLHKAVPRRQVSGDPGLFRAGGLHQHPDPQLFLRHAGAAGVLHRRCGEAGDPDCGRDPRCGRRAVSGKEQAPHDGAHGRRHHGAARLARH